LLCDVAYFEEISLANCLLVADVDLLKRPLPTLSRRDRFTTICRTG
jgi:hypothetical protein